jgi:putative transposase
VVLWLGLSLSKFYTWRTRYGKVNEHNAQVPRDTWLLEEEKQAILDFERDHPTDGYRRLTFMMLDEDVAAAAPSTVYRVLQGAGRLDRWAPKGTKKGQGFHQPDHPHKHWHLDISYVNVCGTFYYLISVLDGYSRYIVHWEIRESMTEQDTEIVLQRAREAFPGESPRVITDNGSQFISRDFKEFIRITGMTHVRTSPYYPQSNGKLERWHGTIKAECIRPGTPLSVEDARRIVTQFVEHYNTARLHSAIGYVTPTDKLLGLEKVIHEERDRKLEQAREERRARRATQQDWQEAAPDRPVPSQRIDFREFRRQVGIQHVLDRLGFWDSMRGHGSQRRGPCPLHDQPHEDHRSFSVNTQSNVFRCFHPECQAQGNALDLWAAVHHLPVYDAAVHLAQTFGINAFRTGTEREEEPASSQSFTH